MHDQIPNLSTNKEFMNNSFNNLNYLYNVVRIR